MRKFKILLVLMFFSSFVFSQQTIVTKNLKAKQTALIGEGTLDNAAIFEVISTTKGALLPRMTETQRDNLTLADGLIIYNTSSNMYQFHNGTGWMDFSGISSVVAGANITVDNTDPLNPVIASTAVGTGDVVGPVSSVDNRIPRYDGVTGKLIDQSNVIISNSGSLSGVENILLSGTVDGIDISTDVAANTAKISNATHTGEVTGATALTVDVTAISNKTLVTAVGADHVLIEDATDGTLKKVLASDLLSGGNLWTEAGSDIHFNTGNVGINNVSPSAKLDVVGQVEIFDNTSFINSTHDFSGHTGLNFITIGVNGIAAGASDDWISFGANNALVATDITSSFISGQSNFRYATSATFSFASGLRNFFGESGVSGNTDYNFGNGKENFFKKVSGSYNFGVGIENFYNDSLSVGSFGAGAQNFYNANKIEYSFASGFQNYHDVTIGKYNFASGIENFFNLGTGDNNFASGFRNFYSVTGIGSNNFGAGFQNFFTNTSSIGNIGIGQEVGYHIASGNYNIMFGNRAGYSVAAITNNSIVIGNGAGKGATSLSNSIILGAEAMDANSNSLVVSIGFKDQPDASNQISIGSSTNYSTAKFRNYRFNIDQSLTGLDDYHLTYNEGSDYFEATTPAMGTHIFDYDQVIGVSEDNFVETYDNGTGLVSLEVIPEPSFVGINTLDTTDQVIATINTAQYITFTTNVILVGISHAVGTDLITINKTGYYDITLTPQLTQSAGAGAVEFWLEDSGVTVPNSGVLTTIDSNEEQLPILHWTQHFTAADTLKLPWASNSTNTKLDYVVSSYSGANIPSVMLNVVFIGE